MTHLLHLNISNCSLGSHGARVFSTVIPFVSNLQSLRLTHNHMFGRSMRRICASISYLTDLHLLNLSNNSLEEQGALDLSQSLKYCQMMTHLYVAQPQPTEVSIFLTNSFFMHLNHFSLGEIGIQSLFAEALPVLSNLQSLRVDNNGAPPNADCFQIHMVQALSCVRLSIVEICFRQLGSRLHFATNIHEEKSCSGMRADVARVVVEALSFCSNLVSLDDDALSKLLLEFQKNRRFWNPELVNLSQSFFPKNCEDVLSSSQGIKEIFESSIVRRPRSLSSQTTLIIVHYFYKPNANHSL